MAGSREWRRPLGYTSLHQVPRKVRKPRPEPGTNFPTVVHIFGRRYRALLDTGATTNTIPESVVHDVLNRVRIQRPRVSPVREVALCRRRDVSGRQGTSFSVRQAAV